MNTPTLHPLWSLPFRSLAWLASGQAVQWLTANAWETYWRSREFAADQYAARLGQEPALTQTLEHSSLPYERSIPNMRFSRATHPYTKPRIAKLRAQPAVPAPTPHNPSEGSRHAHP
jgi:Zn-dependent protease with chaperone function